MIFINYYQDIFSSKHKRKYFFLHLESARSLRPSRSTSKTELLPSAEATTKRLFKSSKLSPRSRNTTRRTMEKTFTVLNSKNSKPCGKKPIHRSPTKTPTSRSLGKSAFKLRTSRTTSQEAYVLNARDWFSLSKVSTMNYQ